MSEGSKLVIALAVVIAAMSMARAEWSAYGGAPGGGQYSSLARIDRSNVSRLKLAWTFRTGELGAGLSRAGKLTFESNPIVVGDRLYLNTALGAVFALDAASGRQLWKFDPRVDRSPRFSEVASRGVSSWIDARAPAAAACRHAIFVGTLDARLVALDGATGEPCAAFGNAGAVDLRAGIRARGPGDYTVTSPPAIIGDVVVVGSAIGDNRAVDLEEGVVRGYDARSGRLLWSWDPVPRDAGASNENGWQPRQAARTGAANAWAPLSSDPARGLVFVPTSSPSPDFYGGERLGDNRDANSLVALRAATGEVAWRRQLVHHDLWDHDLAAQPVVADLVVGGRPRPAVIQATKTGFVFVLDRDTGEPIFPIHERPVPASDVDGETASRTQPFPDPAFRLARTQRVTEDDAWGFTFFDRAACRKKIAALRSDGAFTPPSLRGTLMFPGYAGGVNWGGVSFDPVRQVAVVGVLELPMAVTLIPKQPVDKLAAMAASGDYPKSEFARMEGTPYGLRREPLLSPFGAPCTAPPWGKLVALDMGNGGRRLWERPIGTTAEMAPISLEIGMPFQGGPVTTAGGLVFMAATVDNMLRAYDRDSGKVLWEAKLPAGGNATPSVYEAGGRQYVVIAAGGHGAFGTKRGDYVLAYALP